VPFPSLLLIRVVPPTFAANSRTAARPNPLQAAGREAGLKLMEIKRLREKGYRITLLDDRQFWRLVVSGKRRKED